MLVRRTCETARISKL